MVQVQRTTFSRDAAAGPQPDNDPLEAPVRCAVQPTSAEVITFAMREQGVEYLTVKFYDDPKLKVRDELVDEQGRVLVATGIRGSSGGAYRTWLVDCEYTPVPGA